MLIWGIPFNRVGWFSLILVLGLVAAGCGSEDTSTPTATSAPLATATPTQPPLATPTSTPSPTPTQAPGAAPRPTPTATPRPPATPTPTPSPTPTQAPGETPRPTSTPTPTPTATPEPPDVKEITVSVNLFFFDPKTINLTPGETVKFTITNPTTLFHTFTVALTSGKQQILLDIPLNGGETKSTEFTVPPVSASLYLFCLPHESIGMTGSVNVGGSGQSSSGSSGSGGADYPY